MAHEMALLSETTGADLRLRQAKDDDAALEDKKFLGALIPYKYFRIFKREGERNYSKATILLNHLMKEYIDGSSYRV